MGKSCTGFSHGKGRSWPELVSHAPDGQNMLGVYGVFFDASRMRLMWTGTVDVLPKDSMPQMRL